MGRDVTDRLRLVPMTAVSRITAAVSHCAGASWPSSPLYASTPLTPQHYGILTPCDSHSPHCSGQPSSSQPAPRPRTVARTTAARARRRGGLRRCATWSAARTSGSPISRERSSRSRPWRSGAAPAASSSSRPRPPSQRSTRRTSFTLSLDIDPNERAEDLSEYARREGFDWRFAVAPREVTRSLAATFGDQVLSPPSTPLIVLGPDGDVVEQHIGIKVAGELAALFEEQLR
jgi:hypothetical protein